ncbi:MAG: aminopeptidase P family protein [Candidatus Hydrogenedentes bacterium]|nr:aminopeptidase P family protein [Candidatus Hydrogenedentota bacterium]
MNDRLARLQGRLRDAGLDVFISFSAPANEYLSGFRGSTSALAVTPSDAIFLCDFRYTEQAQGQVKGFEVREAAGTLEIRIAEVLNSLGVRQAAFDPTAITYHQHQMVRDTYSGALTPDTDLVAGLRLIKSDEEIAKLRAASLLAEDALAEVMSTLKAGLSEREFAAKLEYAFKVRGAQGPSFSPIVLFGARSSLPHGVPTAKPLEYGDIVLLDLGCILDSYCSDLTRTFVFGTIPGTWFESIYETALRAQMAALDAVAPGKACRDVDAIARNIIADAGYGDYFGHGLGHGVGLEVHEAPRLNMQSSAVLEPGMIVTIEPGIYLPGKGGVRIEDLVAVTETGYEVLTHIPKSLRVL